MAGALTKQDLRNKTRINMRVPDEVTFFKKKFKVTGQALAGAIRATGSTSVKKVETYLKSK